MDGCVAPMPPRTWYPNVGQFRHLFARTKGKGFFVMATAHHHPKSIVANEQKFKELILYICQTCADDPKFGATKLNKILFFSDFLQYANTGAPITGVEYQRLPNGPAPRRLIPVRKAMESKRELAVLPIALASGKTQQKPAALRAANLELFTASEISLVDGIIAQLRDSTASDVSDVSHRFISWIVARDNETIPYNTIFISSPPLSVAEKHRGRELAKHFGD